MAQSRITEHHFSDAEGRPEGGQTLGVGFTIAWQRGPLGAVGSKERKEQNGAFVEDVIRAAIGRVAFYQASGFACRENENALRHLNSALRALEDRTQRRIAEKTEGTHAGI